MRFKWKYALMACLVLLCCLLAASGESFVRLSDRWERTNATHLAAVLTGEDLPLLDRFPRLSSLDLSGSDCYEEILVWAQTHPEVDVRYTVAFPDGSVVENAAAEVDLSALDPALAEEALPLLRYLPALEKVDLGDASRGLSPEQAASFLSAYPDVAFAYSFRLLGQSLSSDTTALDLSRCGHRDTPELLRYLPVMKHLQSINLGKDESETAFTWEDIASIEAACPEAACLYDFTLFGRTFSLTDSSMDLSRIPMDDGGAAVRQVIACMPRLRTLDMDSCRVSNADMLSLREDFPNIKIIWRVWFGEHYSVRTDTERILASMPGRGGNVTVADIEALSCCSEVKYIDLGHNVLVTDISFVSSMPKLEVAVLAMNYWTDASPLADCPELEYLEIQTTYLSDLTPLSGLKKLKHLNICYLFDLEDISPLYELTQLERLWIGCLDPVPAEQIARMQELAPDCEINTTAYDPTEGGWRYDRITGEYVPRYTLLREQFGDYALGSFSFSWNDPLYASMYY